jgi:hypothetical protein
MGTPIRLLTFKRAVGGGTAAGASSRLGRAANCALDVNIHNWKRATGYYYGRGRRAKAVIMKCLGEKKKKRKKKNKKQSEIRWVK